MLAVKRSDFIKALVIICLLLSGESASANEMRLFRLNYASPYSVVNTLESLFKGQLTAVAAPSINAVVVRTATPSLFDDIKALIDLLDRKPATFRFSVRSQHKSSQKAQGLNSGISLERSTAARSSERSIVVVEMNKASFTDEKVRIFRISGPYYSHSVPVVVSDGLMVSGRLTNNNRIAVQIWFSQAGSLHHSEQLLTELEVKPGEWFSIGGLQQSTGSESSSINVGSATKFKATTQTYTSEKQYLLKADLIQ